jgi:hypothetical protein
MLLSRHTRRREFIALLAGAIAARPVAARTIRRPPVEAALARTKCRKITGCKTTGSGADINDLWWGRVFIRSTMK